MQKDIEIKIKKAIQILKHGGIVIYPTDTAYAIGCRFKNQKSINKILRIKKRKDTKFTLITSSITQVKKFFKLNSCQIKMAKKYWPGPLSIVVSSKYSIRVPKCEIARKLARGADMPIIATSLNISGEPTIYDLKKISVEIGRDPSPRNIYIIDIGPLTKRPVSTIMQCLLNKTRVRTGRDLPQHYKVKIIRHGSINPKISSK